MELLSNLLTNSRLSDARACQRLHYIKYLLGYRSVRERRELRVGHLVHAGLEAWWLAWRLGGSDERLDLALAAVAGEEVDPYDRALVEVLLEGYHFRWSEDPSEQYETLGAEEEFRAALRNPKTGRPSPIWEIAGKLDVRTRDLNDGLPKIVEHKTAASDISPGSDYLKRLRMDSQISLYFDGGLALGEQPATVVYDVLKKPGIRPLKATPIEARKYNKKTGELYANQRDHDETPEEFKDRLRGYIAERPNEIYVRSEVVRLERELEEARHDIWQVATQVRESIKANRFPRNSDSCWRYGSLCPFFGVCAGEASLDDPTLYVKVSNVHPELSEVNIGQ
ncbi:MAG TPA: PD-(D/E)XK nuclease family protein [Candidatus Binatia bacterium]|nr:PD-(D/E)XK nuclease family protein [Candidatus Binatia bacterium]